MIPKGQSFPSSTLPCPTLSPAFVLHLLTIVSAPAAEIGGGDTRVLALNRMLSHPDGLILQAFVLGIGLHVPPFTGDMLTVALLRDGFLPEG
jgi:hypothetical protein